MFILLLTISLVGFGLAFLIMNIIQSDLDKVKRGVLETWCQPASLAPGLEEAFKKKGEGKR